MTSFIEIADVSKTYGSGPTEVQALRHASLELSEGEFLAIVGPSGSGKTTALSVLGGLLTPTTGSVRIGSERIDGMKSGELTRFRAKHIGFVFQSANLIPFMTARENVLYASTLPGRSDDRLSKSDARTRADALLAELGLEQRAKAMPNEMSGGERQRVAIARALMNDPDLILVDEPTSALDTVRGNEVLQLLTNEVRQRNKTAVMVTHDLRMVDYVDRVVTMTDGVLVHSSEPQT